MRKAIFMFLLLYSVVMIAGLVSDACLGDELYHCRFAKNFYWQGERPTVDILYKDSSESEIVKLPDHLIYYGDMLWHGTLAQIWKICGHISFTVAQLYQSLYYVLLVILTYLLAREIYGKEAGFYAAILIGTVPMVAVFGILLYTDVPATVFCVLCVLLVVKRRYFWTGIALGLMYLCKRNGLLFFPVILLLSFCQDKVALKIRFRNAVLLLVGAAVVVSPDLYWREVNFKGFPPNRYTSVMVVFNRLAGVRARVGAGRRAGVDPNKPGVEPNKPGVELKKPHVKPIEYDMAPVGTTEVGDMKTFANMLGEDFPFIKYIQRVLWLSYFGLAILIGLPLYLICRRYRRKDIILWALIGTYLLVYFRFLGLSNEVRYMLPIVPFLCILAAVPIAASKNKLGKAVIIAVCLAQFLAAAGYLCTKRQVPQQIEDGFEFVRENAPQDARLFYVEHIALDRTNRKIQLPVPGHPLLKKMFWAVDTTEVLGAMNQMSIDYIMVKKARIYDDSNRSYFNGYPKSFIDRLPELTFMKLVFDNRDMSIWQVE